MRVIVLPAQQKATGLAAIIVNRRLNVDPRDEMSTGRYPITIGTREIVNVIAKTLDKTLSIKGYSYHIDDLAA